MNTINVIIVWILNIRSLYFHFEIFVAIRRWTSYTINAVPVSSTNTIKTAYVTEATGCTYTIEATKNPETMIRKILNASNAVKRSLFLSPSLIFRNAMINPP